MRVIQTLFSQVNKALVLFPRAMSRVAACSGGFDFYYRKGLHLGSYGLDAKYKHKKGVAKMCFYIGIEDLAANAMIEILKKNGQRFLTYDEIEMYGAEVVQILRENGEKAVLILSRENTDALFRNYSEFFEEGEEGGKRGIKLKVGKKVDDLIQQFRGYLALDVLLAFMNQRSIQVLGV